MKNVLLVFGGLSYEHDISIVTASQIFNKTKLDDYKLIPLYISKDGKYFVYRSNEFSISDFKCPDNLNKKKFTEVVFISSEKNIMFSKGKLGLKEYLKVNLAIFACHGGRGENGGYVSVFESYGIKSSAGNTDALGICMNKYLFKQTMIGLKIPAVYGMIITKFGYEKNKNTLLSKISKLKFPLVLKPNNGGSSIGLFIVTNADELDSKLAEAFEFDSEVIVEKFISVAREFNVAILGDRNCYEISEIDEPIKKHEILSFADKYLSDDNSKFNKIDKSLKNSMASSVRKFPADIDAELSLRIKKIAVKIFESLNLRGVVRIDFLFDEKNGKLYVCEVNAIPGSLSFYFFSKNEILINNFTAKLIKIAENSKGLDEQINREFITDIIK